MWRAVWVSVAALLLALAGAVWSADDKPANHYKITVRLRGQENSREVPLWLVKLESKEGKWTGQTLAAIEPDFEAKLLDLKAEGDKVSFTLQTKGQKFVFEGKLPRDNKPGLGTVSTGPGVLPARLEPTKLSAFDPFEMQKENLAEKTGPEVIDTASYLLSQAGKKKAKPEEVRAWAAKAFKAAEPYGPSLQRQTAMQISQILAEEGAFVPVALEYARKADNLLDAKAKNAVQKMVLDVLADVLAKSKKNDELKEVEARLTKLEKIKIDKFTGRKNTSSRVVLVELFTGAQCPPCVAADLAFDALLQTYRPAEIALLQYHQHIPGPDPLTSPAGEERLSYYRSEVEGTPTILFDGILEAGGGGSKAEGQDVYDEYHKVVQAHLETPEKAKMKASAVQKNNKIDIQAEVSDVTAEALDHLRLRVALVEEQVQYTGSNKLEIHSHVVRAMPGGNKGFALKDKTTKETATVDLEELRKDLKKYLDHFAENKRPFPNKNRPLDLKKLKVVAFVQNDKTKEILQAVQVDVQGEEAGAGN